METYCLKCKKYTKNVNNKGKITKNKKLILMSKCNECGSKKSRFVSFKEIKGNGILSNIFKNIPILNKLF